MKKPFLLKLFATVMLICLSMAMLTACENVNVEVTFIVDDEVYAVVNLQEGDTVEMPEDPTKDGFVFDGWYLDKDIWKKPFIGKVEDTTLVKLDVYAKWVEGETQCNHVWSQWTVGVEPTCSAEGKQGRYCLKCSKTEVEDIEKLAHTEEVIPAVEPTCQSEGVTEGKKCSVCNEVLIAPQTVAKKEHNYGKPIIDEEPNCTYAGSQHKVCQNEGCEDRVDEEIPANDIHDYVKGVCSRCKALDSNYGSKGLEFTLNEDNESYSVSGIGTCTDTDVVIPAVYNEKPVTTIGSNAFKDCKSLTKVTLSDVIASIGEATFYGCSGLTSITISNSVTLIERNAFSVCRGLTKVDYLGTIDKWGQIEFGNASSNPLNYAHNLYIDNKLITEANITTTSINDYAFYNCTSLKKVSITNSVTSIGNSAFNGCSVLTSATIGDSITFIDNSAFKDCKSLTTVTIPSNVASISDSIFSGCSGLTNITIPNGVTSIGEDAFFDCSGLESIIVAEGNTNYRSKNNCLIETESKTLILGCKNSIIPNDGSVTSIGEDAFWGCSSLTSITIPNSVTSIGSWAFYRCEALTSVTIGNGVTSIGMSAFAGCSTLTSITIPDSVYSIGENAFGDCNNLQYNEYNNALYLGSKDNPYFALIKPKDESITSCIINDKTKVIADDAFERCSGLTSVIIPDSVTSIGRYAFSGCKALTSIIISNSVTFIGSWAFRGCSGLIEIKFNGTVVEWDNIKKGFDWNSYIPATKVICTDGEVAL